MGSREIFALRKQGRSGEALEMARAQFPENKDDIWFLRAYAWPIYDRAKALVEQYEAKQLSGPRLSGEFASAMNEFADMANPLRGDPAFSHMLRLAGKVSKDWDDFLLFARWAGLDSFSEDDEKPFTAEDGKTIDSLKMRFTRAICRETARRAGDVQADPDLIEWGQGVLDQALETHPDDQWLNYYQSRLHLAKGEHDQALERLMPVLHRQSRAAWPWALLGELLEATHPDDALTCLIHATQLARKEQEVTKVRIRLASRLARENRFDEAARQVALASEYRAQNNFRVPPPLQQLIGSDWYKRAKNADSFRDLPRVDADARKLLRELDRQRFEYTIGVIDNINLAKALSHAAIGKDKGFVLSYRDFPKIAQLPLGTLIGIGHAQGDTRACDWRRSESDVLPDCCEVVAGTLTRRDGQAFAFIRGAQGDVFVSPALAESFAPGECHEVTCLAVWSTSKQGKAGWRAVTIANEVIGGKPVICDSSVPATRPCPAPPCPACCNRHPRTRLRR